MKLLKPDWVSHDGKPIFSIDVHPAGKRFATGGQGGDSGRVVVWNLKSVLDVATETDGNIPKMLCQMDNHLACVNSVRWSNRGKYLASGGDDKLIMIWSLSSAGSSAVFGSNGKLNVETWRCTATLRGHAGDVLDLAWSPMDKWLASCSVDNTIIIWNAQKLPEMICVLNGHSGLVKGVAWDPIGKFVASQSDDKTLRVWKTADWTLETVVTEPFEECGGTTHVLRLSWSPDGQYLVSAHAMNGGGPTAQIVERDGWKCDMDFVGHRKAVTCVRFNSNIFDRKDIDKQKCACCVAVGSRDRTLSVWLTSLKRPLVVIQDLFTDSVLDLSWSSDGLILLSCSWDGTVACIQFTHKEVGNPLSSEAKNALCERKYGKYLANSLCPEMTSNLLVEGPEILQARDAKDKEDSNTPTKPDKTEKNCLVISPVAVTDNTSPMAMSSPVTPIRPIDRQIETRTSDGKRRITPVFIPVHQAMDPNESLSSTGNACFSSSSAGKSRIVVERRDDIITHPNVSNHATPAPATALPAPVGPTAPTTFAGATILTQPVDQNELDNRLKRRAVTSPARTALPGPCTAELCTGQPGHGHTQQQESGHTQTQTVHTSIGGSTPAVLPAPALGTAGPVVRYAGKYRVQVLNNACSTPHGKLSRVQLLPGNSASSEPLWETFLGSPVNCIAVDGVWACVSCEDGSLHMWSVLGASGSGGASAGDARMSRAWPPLALGSRAVRLSLSRSAPLLLALTAHALLTVWDLTQGTCTVPPLCIGRLVPNGVTVSSCSIMDDGNPMISLSNGKGYIYSKKMCTWIVACDGSDPLWKCVRGSVARSPPAAPHALLAPLASLQAATLLKRPRDTAPSYTQGSYQSGATVSWLESQLSCCLQLGSGVEYRHWLLLLVTHLLEHGTEKQLRLLLDDLLGPSHCTSKSSKWQSSILGISKHELLQEILSMMGKQLRWQRLYMEYSEQISSLKEMLEQTNGHS